MTEKKAKLGGKNFYYLAIDGTDTVDSAEFGLQMESFGFRNLLGEFLKDNKSPYPKENEPARVVDPNHPFLPIWRVWPSYASDDDNSHAMKEDGSHKGAAVVCPSGLNSWGADAFWKLRSGAADGTMDSTGFMEQLILKPAVVQNADKSYGIAGPGDTAARSAHVLALSSHGWLGGFMAGNLVYEGGRGWGQYWTIIGGIAKGTTTKAPGHFEGPLWLILAQCSTVCMATWPSWVEVMARSKPAVRGVIAYEEVAPAAGTAGKLFKRFFNLLDPSHGKPMSILQAWKQINDDAGRSWAAIIHSDAVDDTLSKFDNLPALRDPKTDGIYLGWSQTHDGTIKRQPIRKETPPFSLELAIVGDDARPGRFVVDETNLNIAKLKPTTSSRPDYYYDVTLSPPATLPGAAIREGTLEWVHIRLSKDSFDGAKIFSLVNPVPTYITHEVEKYPHTITAPNGTKKTLQRTRYRFKIPSDIKISSFSVRFYPVNDFSKIATDNDHYPKDDKIVAHHSYLWLRASLKLDGTDLQPFDFTTRGLIYFGG